jgi:hypothetical protein
MKDLEGVNYALAWEAKAPSGRLYLHPVCRGLFL